MSEIYGLGPKYWATEARRNPETGAAEVRQGAVTFRGSLRLASVHGSPGPYDPHTTQAQPWRPADRDEESALVQAESGA